MKKIISAIMSAAIALSSFAALAVTANAEDTWAPTATSYTADFTNANELSKWNFVSGNNNAEVSNGIMKFQSAVHLMLPVAKMKNFVLDMDMIHTSGNNNIAVNFGLDAAPPTNAGKFKVRFKAKKTRADLSDNGTVRDSNDTYGAYQYNITPYLQDEVNSDIYQTSKIRVVVYNNRFAAWMNDQLIYSYTLSDTYAAGYIGVENNAYAATVRSLSVREATASDLVFAESFSEASKQGYTSLVANSTPLKTKNWGAADMSRANWITYIDTNKALVGDHMYSAGFTFGSTNYGDTRFMEPLFGIIDNEDGTKSAWGVATRINGEIIVSKLTIAADGTFSSTDTKIISASATRAMFPDKVQKMTYENKEYDVLKLDTMWEYRHVLSNGTLYIYLDDVLVGTCTKDEFKELSGYTGFTSRGMNSMIYYVGVRGVEADDLNRVNKVKVTDENASALANKVVRVYNADNVLYGTTYANANGMFDMDMGHNQTYTIKAYDTDGTLVAETDEAVTYVSDGSTNTFALTKLTPSAATDITVVEAYEDGQELEDGRVVEGDASLLEFAVNANDYAVSKITVTPTNGTTAAQACTTTLTAGTEAVIGIIVNSYVADDNAAKALFTVTVE